MDYNEKSGRFMQFCSIVDASNGESYGELLKRLSQRHKQVFEFVIDYPDTCKKYFDEKR